MMQIATGGQEGKGGEAALLRGVATTSWMLVKRWQLRDWRVHGQHFNQGGDDEGDDTS